MKKFLFAVVAGFIPALVLTTEAIAQDSINIAMLEPAKNQIKMDNVSNPVKENTANLSAISTKAVKDFRKAFKSVSDEKWMKNSDGFSAGFTSNGISNTIFYDQKGRWVGSLKGYDESKFDQHLRDMVRREYLDYKITYVQEAETLDSKGVPTYIVHLEDASNIKLIRVSNGVMDIYQAFKKQS